MTDALIRRSVDFMLSQAIFIFVCNVIQFLNFFSQCLHAMAVKVLVAAYFCALKKLFFGDLHSTNSIFHYSTGGKGENPPHVIRQLNTIEKSVDLRNVHWTIAEHKTNIIGAEQIGNGNKSCETERFVEKISAIRWARKFSHFFTNVKNCVLFVDRDSRRLKCCV